MQAQEHDRGEHAEQCGDKDKTIRTAPIDKGTADARTEKLPDAEEYGIQTHNGSAIARVIFGNVGEMR